MSSFNNLQKYYNITQQQEKNKESIPADELEPEEVVEEEADREPAEEPEEPAPPAPPKDGNETKKFIQFLDRTIFKLTGMRSFTKPDIQRTI